LLAGSKTLPTTGDATQKSEQDLVQPDLQIDATNATQSTAAKLHVNFAGQASINLIDVDEKLIQTSGASTANLMHVRIGQNDCDISVMEAGKLKAFQNVKSFYLAQFRTAFGEKITISKQQLSADASLKTLAALFDAADHDVDGNLSLSELRDFLTLLERGVASQTTITIGSHGHSLFNSLDANHDGRLNCGELNSASSRLLPAAAPNTTPNSTTASSISRDQIPIRYQLNFERGSPSNTFGPVQIPGRPKRATETTPAAVTKGPRWFERLDRNSDGLLSPAEFPGSIELFGRLDADHNGLISTDESQTK
jgi:Ca2+-binding EF-hand superfamily protein